MKELYVRTIDRHVCKSRNCTSMNEISNWKCAVKEFPEMWKLSGRNQNTVIVLADGLFLCLLTDVETYPQNTNDT
jgi:hypothetical protein